MQPYQRAAKTILASPKLLGNLLLVSVNDGRLVALDKRTGKPRWEHDFGAPVTSSPALAEGKIFLAVGDGNLYAFDADKLPY
jgi:outer membrane protein assembly factor BamB